MREGRFLDAKMLSDGDKAHPFGGEIKIVRKKSEKFPKNAKKYLTNAFLCAISNAYKPVSKRSSNYTELKESCRRWEGDSERNCEWTCEGGANAVFASSYRRGPHPLSAAAGMIVPETSGRYASTWVVPQDHESCPKWLGQGFFCTHFSRKDEEYAQTK